MRRVTSAVAVMVLGFAAVIGFVAGAMIGANQRPEPDIERQAIERPVATPSATPEPAGPQITLSADPSSVGRNEDIRLSGAVTPGAGDVPLQVERSINGGEWGDFPVSTTSKGDGSFSVRVQTGRTGTVEFRVRGEIDGETVRSEPVAVQVG